MNADAYKIKLTNSNSKQKTDIEKMQDMLTNMENRMISISETTYKGKNDSVQPYVNLVKQCIKTEFALMKKCEMSLYYLEYVLQVQKGEIIPNESKLKKIVDSQKILQKDINEIDTQLKKKQN